MSLFDSIKSKLDQSGDGRIGRDDLESLRNNDNGSIIDKLKSTADQTGDGKIGMDDLKNLDAGNTLRDLKNSLF